MKKVINITIGGLIFFVEEGAYNALRDYLDRIKQHFVNFPDSGEIVRDMEARIAEHFEEEKIGIQSKVITMHDVNSLIKTMGQVEDFAVNDTGTEQINEAYKTPRKLFRNPDDKIIGGVSSGLAAYFGMDPIIVRILFAVLTVSGFFSGFAILFYIVLWLAVPEAKTPTEKMQMKGDPITVAKVEENIKQKTAEDKKNNGTQKLIRLPALIISAIGKFLKALLPIIGRILGLVISIAGVAAIIGASAIFVTLLINPDSPYIDFPLQTILHGLEYHLVVSLVFVLAFIPIMFILLAGISLLTIKNKFNKPVSLSLLVVWAAAIIVSISLTIRLAPKYKHAMENDPRNQLTTKTFDAAGFAGIEAGGGDKIRISKGENFTVSANGKKIDIDRLELTVNNNILTISHGGGIANDFKICIFCEVFRKEIVIEIQMPELTEIKGSGAVNIFSSGFESKTLTVGASGASEITLNHIAETIGITASGASEIELYGKTNSLTVKLSGASEIDAQNMTANTVTIEASGSSEGAIRANNNVDIDASGASEISVFGNPKITSELSGASKVYSEEQRAVEGRKDRSEPLKPILETENIKPPLE